MNISLHLLLYEAQLQGIYVSQYFYWRFGFLLVLHSRAITDANRKRERERVVRKRISEYLMSRASTTTTTFPNSRYNPFEFINLTSSFHFNQKCPAFLARNTDALLVQGRAEFTSQNYSGNQLGSQLCTSSHSLPWEGNLSIPTDRKDRRSRVI
jgi:hypothetical protein